MKAFKDCQAGELLPGPDGQWGLCIADAKEKYIAVLLSGTAAPTDEPGFRAVLSIRGP
jgi:hypothetical protein